MKTKKLSFCITCMNRLNHLQQTLEKNIRDNYLKDEVEFVLLDYNSQDGLSEWINSQMKKYVDEGILVYYHTTEPSFYFRPHCRNMAFRLANTPLICNLDADNFLGKGFAQFMLQEFSKQDNIFYTNNYSCHDTFGRSCFKKEDFLSVRGYNEALKGYGYADIDFFNRLRKAGLSQLFFHNPEFYHYIKHSKAARTVDELLTKNTDRMYISYINPSTSGILLLNKDYTTERYAMVDNIHLNPLVEYSNVIEQFTDERNRIVLREDRITGIWSEDNDTISILENNVGHVLPREANPIDFMGLTYYKVEDDELKTEIIILLSSAFNYHEACKQMNCQSEVNPDGFGKGIVYKNFDLSKEIILT